MGVNVQRIFKNKICVYTLGMIELQNRHTAINLKAEIEKLLEEFEIKKSQIYSITTDNGRNLIKTVELLNCDSNNDFGQDDITEELNILESK